MLNFYCCCYHYFNKTFIYAINFQIENEILTKFSDDEDGMEIGINGDVNSKNDDARDIYINDYDNHIIILRKIFVSCTSPDDD